MDKHISQSHAPWARPTLVGRGRAGNLIRKRVQSVFPTWRSRQGFTLVEVLVVIVIIAVLAALIVPAASSLQSRFYAVGCANNMKQIVGVLHHYVSDNDGWMPWHEYGTENGINFGTAMSGSAPEMALALGGYFDTCADVLRCPGWRDWGANSPSPAPSYFRTPFKAPVKDVRHSYNYHRMIPEGWERPPDLNASVPRIKMASIQEPSKVWYVCDSSFGKHYAPKDITFSVTRSHRNGGNAGFIDGHVEFIPREGWTTNGTYLNYPLLRSKQFKPPPG